MITTRNWSPPCEKCGLDLESPIPIYHQIADAIRRKIRSGELAPGARLAPLREAAEQLGVNLHTVRHAYTELARQGLVESRRAAGTHIAKRPSAAHPRSPDLGTFLSTVVTEAEQRFGLGPAELASALGNRAADRSTGRPRVVVIECSDSQCRDLGAQLEAQWAVEAQPWSLEQDHPPPQGTVVATYFHYNEIRRRWPERLPAIHFLSIRPDPAVADELRGRVEDRPVEATLCELDRPTLEAVAADLSITLPGPGFSIATRLLEAPHEALDLPGTEPLLLPPRVWGALDPNRADGNRLIQVRYLFDATELNALGESLYWESAA